MQYTDILFALVGDVSRNSRALRQLRALSAEGYSIRVLSFRPASGFVRVHEDRPAENVQVETLALPGGKGPRFFRAIHEMVQQRAREITARVYHASDLYTLPALAGAAALHHGNLVYDAREVYPHTMGTHGKPWSRAFWSVLERRFIKKTHLVLTVGQAIADHLVRTYRIPRPIILHNVPTWRAVREPGDALGYLRRQLGLGLDRTLILHLGRLVEGRGLDHLVEAMRQVPRAVLIFMGEGPLQSSLEAAITRVGAPDRFRFLPAVAPDRLPQIVPSADIGVVLSEATTLNLRYSLPNKLFECLASGLPVVASDLPEMGALVSRNRVGLTAVPGDSQAIAVALRKLVEDVAMRRRLAANIKDLLDKLDWDHEKTPFLKAYRTLVH